ncbi:hypothetical protein [Paenibacillus sp. N3.4]|uniref:hypothetical protein n=1 Tax=Paenibacillus sp. N3.4 TaxID=2603222 RepID=UPI0011C776F7|nr:hypothetical protein [Paenibacillus sp. N3.4]TXK85426.1 hypothetical protein FU659_04010 [Paenibacillus sp. N3.4]
MIKGMAILGLSVMIAGVMTACSMSSPGNQAGASSSNPRAGSWDAGLRNNENPSLGVKSVNQSPQPTVLQPTIDNVKAHANTHLTLNRDLADQIIQTAHVGSTAVAVTDHNIYVAVDSGGIQTLGKEDTLTMLSKNNDSVAGAGLFGSGIGGSMDWLSAKPLSPESSQAVRHLLTRVYPEANIFISTNPHYVNRMMYYDGQQRQSKPMDTFLNEFNTMVQYAFPSYSTGQIGKLP